MTRAELRAAFKEHLNRTDCTDALADRFISMGCRRLERTLRLPSMEKWRTYQSDGLGSVYIPNDYIQLIGLYADGQRLQRVSDSDGPKRDKTGRPSVYWKEGVKFQIRGAPPASSEIRIKYYGEFETFQGDNYETLEMAVFPDALMYQALVFAGDHFLDERKQVWKSELAEMTTELQNTADLDEMAGYDLRMGSPFQDIDY